MILPSGFESGLTSRGFARIRSGKNGMDWRKILDRDIYWDLAFNISSANRQLLGCSVVVRYHPAARDSWGDEHPFDIVIRQHDLTSRGLEQIGTPGSAMWRNDRPVDFFATLDMVISMLSHSCQSRAAILDEAMRQYGLNPKNNSLLMAIAFLQYEVGRIEESRKSFDAFLALVPSLRTILSPKIESLFH